MYYVGSIPCIEYDVLIHYGIPGMKWGVRRFQNKDGTLTQFGKERKKYVKQLEKKPGFKKALAAEVEVQKQSWDFFMKRYGQDNYEVEDAWRKHEKSDKKLKALTKISTDFWASLENEKLREVYMDEGIRLGEIAYRKSGGKIP